MPTSQFVVGEEVERIENRTDVRATVLSITERDDENVIEISYVEGGTGWWPESSLCKVADNVAQETTVPEVTKE